MNNNQKPRQARINSQQQVFNKRNESPSYYQKQSSLQKNSNQNYFTITPNQQENYKKMTHSQQIKVRSNTPFNEKQRTNEVVDIYLGKLKKRSNSSVNLKQILEDFMITLKEEDIMKEEQDEENNKRRDQSSKINRKVERLFTSPLFRAATNQNNGNCQNLIQKLKRESFFDLVVEENGIFTLIRAKSQHLGEVLIKAFNILEQNQVIFFTELNKKIREIQQNNIAQSMRSYHLQETSQYIVINSLQNLSNLETFLISSNANEEKRVDIFIFILKLLKTLDLKGISCTSILKKDIWVNSTNHFTILSQKIFPHNTSERNLMDAFDAIYWLRILLFELFPHSTTPNSKEAKIVQKVLVCLKVSEGSQKLDFDEIIGKIKFSLTSIQIQLDPSQYFNNQIDRTPSIIHETFNQRDASIHNIKILVDLLKQSQYSQLEIVDQYSDSVIITGDQSSKIILKAFNITESDKERFSQIENKIVSMNSRQIFFHEEASYCEETNQYVVINNIDQLVNLETFSEKNHLTRRKKVIIFQGILSLLKAISSQGLKCSPLQLKDIYTDPKNKNKFGILSYQLFEQKEQSQENIIYWLRIIISQLFPQPNNTHKEVFFQLISCLINIPREQNLINHDMILGKIKKVLDSIPLNKIQDQKGNKYFCFQLILIDIFQLNKITDLKIEAIILTNQAQ